jgi:L-asparaginase
MKIHIITTGGTIDKVYFDANSEYEVGGPVIGQVLEQMNPSFDYQVSALLKKDSLEMTDEDRELIKKTVADSDSDYILITHGTDGMVKTAQALGDLGNKRVVLTGSMKPAAFAQTDAIFNIGSAIGALNAVAPGAYIMMNGLLFTPEQVFKNYETRRFEIIQ